MLRVNLNCQCEAAVSVLLFCFASHISSLVFLLSYLLPHLRLSLLLSSSLVYFLFSILSFVVAEFEFPAYFNFFIKRKKVVIIVDNAEMEQV